MVAVLLVEETGIPGENHRPVASHKTTGRVKDFLMLILMKPVL